MAKKPNRILNYFKEVKSELKKVVWPSFKQVKNNTLVVIVCVLIIGAFIWILDAAFSSTLGKVVEKWQGTEVTEQTAETTGNSSEEISMKDLWAMYGIGFDEEAGTYTDLETGKEITEEEAMAKAEAIAAEAEGSAETTEETTTENNSAE